MYADAIRPYPAYKPSGVPWLGDLPEHWEVLPGRACYTSEQILNQGMLEKSVLSLSYGQIKIRPEEKLHGLVPVSFETYQLVEPDDIVCRPTDLQNDWNSLRFGFSRHRGIITSAYMCLRTRAELSRRFGYLLLHTYDLKKVFYGLGSGLRQNLSWTDFKLLPCLVPPSYEQAAIVRYLDYVDRRIRRYVSAKRKLIALLGEEKQAVINQAVTRGLDPNVRLKPSGVEWLGDVPEHWETMRTRFLLKEVDTRSTSGRETHLSMSQTLGLVPSHLVEQSLISDSYVGGKLCREGDLVLNRLKAHLGVFALAKQSGVISPDYSVFRKRGSVKMEYFLKVLRLPALRTELRVRAKGIVEGFWRLYTEDFFDIRLPVPSSGEQHAIIEYLDKTTADVDTAIVRARRQIELLQEYRTRLIADVVTGKLDVREAAALLPDEADDEKSMDEGGPLADSVAEDLYDPDESAEGLAMESEVTV